VIVGFAALPAFAQEGGSDLIGITWQWQAQVDSSGETSTTVPNPENYTVLFNEDGTVSVQNDCNGGGGGYTLDGESLTLTGLFTTLIFCGDQSLDAVFNMALNQVESYAVANGVLTLNLADGSKLLLAAEGSLYDGTWEWQSWTDASGTETTVPTPESYTLTFNVDGTVAVQFDCNSGGGGFTLDGSALTFTPLFSTMMMCPEGSLDQQFSIGLSQVTGYELADGTLTLTLADGGTMVFGQPSPLLNMTWYWQSLTTTGGDVTVVPNFNYWLVFNADGTLNAQLDCNSGSGTYTVDGSTLTIGPIATTRMACADPDSLETAFGQALAQVSTYAVAGNVLTLTLADGSTMVFGGTPALDAAAAELINVSWLWQSWTDASGAETTVTNPENYTLFFNADGTVNVQLDCNSGGGGYVVDGSSLTFTGIFSTMMFCGEESLDSAFSAGLNQVVSYSITDGVLTLSLADGGTMTFAQG
jgi:heat shock protein HslJ